MLFEKKHFERRETQTIFKPTKMNKKGKWPQIHIYKESQANQENKYVYYEASEINSHDSR